MNEKYLYAVETDEYKIIPKKFEIDERFGVDGTLGVQLKSAVAIDAWHMSNIVPKELMKCVISLARDSREYHTVVYFDNEKAANDYLEMAQRLRDSRIENDMNAANSASEYIAGMQANINAGYFT